MISLERKNILITGASKGLGAVCARGFAEQGARLALVARSRELLEGVVQSCADPERHTLIAADLLNLEAIPATVDQVMGFLGRIDAVLHVAGGGLGLREPLIAAPDLLSLFRLNVVAASEINRFIVPSMRVQHHGNLVHVGSISGGESTGSVGYNTVKAALAAYVRSLGNELAATSLVVTGIQPGGFRAPGNSWERMEATQPKIVEQFVHQRLPRGRLAQAEEIVPLLSFLCSDAASMMGGCMVPIDAGEGKTYVNG
jgi:3-oxoacyl-[acyl-carrier protein] reductase